VIKEFGDVVLLVRRFDRVELDAKQFPFSVISASSKRRYHRALSSMMGVG
jgi:hypothetical protein